MFRNRNFSYRGIISFLSNHPYLVLVLPLIFIIHPLLAPGVVMFADFPLLETSLFSHKYMSAWMEYGSHNGFETLPRYPFIALGFLLNNLNIGADIISKFYVMLGFSTASFSFYFSFKHFLKNRMSSFATQWKISAVIGSLFYAYNVWSFHKVHHWYLWFGYAILPLFLMLLHSAMKYPIKWKYVLSAVLVWSLVSGYPHMVIFYGLFYLGFSTFFIIRAIRNNESVLNVVKPVLFIMLLYILFNLYWIYPYSLHIMYSGQGLAPSLYITEERTVRFSEDSDFLNVFRLIQDSWRPIIIDVNPPTESLLYAFWVLVSFAFPILAFSTLLLKKNIKYVLTFSVLGIVGIFLALGTNAPYNFYLILLFDFPLTGILRFILREPDKWAFLIALSYSFLLSIFSFEILRKVEALKYKNITTICFLILILSSFILYIYPTYYSTSKEKLDPVILPSEYERLNEYLQNTTSDKVFFMSQDITGKNWNKERNFCCLDETSSIKPNIDTYLPASENYHNYIKNSIIDNKIMNIGNLVFPLGTNYLIYSDDEIIDASSSKAKFLDKVSLLNDFRNFKDIGFFKLYRAGDNTTIGEFNIPDQLMALSGGLDTFTSLSSVPSFSSKDSASMYLEQNLDKEQKIKLVSLADYLGLTRERNDFVFSFLDTKTHILTPYDFTNHGGMTNTWSKDSAINTGYGYFHSHSAELGIESWNFDYGQGIVITETNGANLTIPFDVKEIESNNEDDEDNTYHLFMRFLKSQKGGSVNVKIDNTLVSEISTFDKVSNKLVWDQVGVINLAKGQHELRLENVGGFNAVNIFALIHPEELNKMNQESNSAIKNKSQVALIMEAESNFNNNKGKDTGISQYLFQYMNASNVTGIFNKTISGQLKIPDNVDLASLVFTAKNSTANDSSYSIKDLKITLGNSNFSALSSIFNINNKSLSFVDLGHSNWINENKDILTVSETNSSSAGDNLKVDVKQGNSTRWGVISTDFVPIENTAYNFSLGVSAKDVNQLHSKVYYYDSNKTEISSDFIFGGKDGTFEGNFSKAVSPPPDAGYAQLQIWIKPNTSILSTYSLDYATMEQIQKNSAWVNRNEDILTVSETNSSLAGDNLRVDVKQGNFTHWGVISTDFVPVVENTAYNFSLGVSAKDVNQLHSKVYYYDSNKTEISSSFISDGRDGSFEQENYKFVSPPIGTKYIQLQTWVKANADAGSRYSLDNVYINEFLPRITFDESAIGFESMSSNASNARELGISNTSTVLSSHEAVTNGNTTSLFKIQTKPIPVVGNHLYNYTMTVEGRNLDSLSALASFRNSSDIEYSSMYGNIASSGRAISMSPTSQVFAKFDIIKPTNYSIALRANTCETCGSLQLTLIYDNNDNMSAKTDIHLANVSLKNERSEFKWIYPDATFPLEKGRYELQIQSNSKTDLDSVIVYSNKDSSVNNTLTSNLNDKNNTMDPKNIFTQDLLQPASISDYRKISPTKYVVDIKNSTKPFFMSFAEAYDNLWTASTNSDSMNSNDASNIRTNSIPLYSFINGFYINKTGDFTLTIEYLPQKWFEDAGIISVFVLIVSIIAYFVGKHWKYLTKLKKLT